LDNILSDVRVLDLSHVWFGPWCTMMLADMGADVIRIEPPWGAIDRLGEGAIFGGATYTFHHLNLNKRDLTLDLKSPEGLGLFKELVAVSDVVVQNFSAMSGHTRLTGERHDEEGPPIEMAQAYGDLGPGTMAAMAILAALRHRDRTGRGQMIDVAQLDCMVAYNTALTGFTLSGLRPVEMRRKYPMGRGAGGLLECSDGGWIRLAAYSPKVIDSLRRLLGVEEVTSELVAERTRGMTRDEAVEFYLSENLPVAPVYHVDEVLADPHLAARGMFVDLVHPLAGVVRVPNFPVRFSETPGVVASAAPVLGQHSREVLTGVLGLSDGRVDELVRAGVTSEA